PVSIVTWRGCDALDHLTLQHEVHVFDVARAGEQMKEQWRGHVVRQIPDDAQSRPAARRGRAKHELQRVMLMNRKARQGSRALLALLRNWRAFVSIAGGLRYGWKTFLQQLHQVAVDLNQVEAGMRRGQQLSCERAAARSDLNQCIVRAGRDGLHDA